MIVVIVVFILVLIAVAVVIVKIAVILEETAHPSPSAFACLKHPSNAIASYSGSQVAYFLRCLFARFP
jgi:hypothetical protein